MTETASVVVNTTTALERPGAPRLFLRMWKPPQPAKGIVVVAHGFNSHSGHYDAPARFLASHGFATYAVDLRGRGESGGDRFDVADFSEYVDDIAAAIDLAVAQQANVPLFLLGHSAGGVVAALFALRQVRPLAGLISESFALQLPAPAIALAALRGLSHFLPHAHVVRLKNEDFSRDGTVVAEMNADPLTAGEAQSAQTIAALLRADAEVKAGAPNLMLPTLILHGGADRATDPEGSRWFHDHLGSPDKTLRIYDGAAHDLLRDIDRAGILSEIVEWLTARIS